MHTRQEKEVNISNIGNVYVLQFRMTREFGYGELVNGLLKRNSRRYRLSGIMLVQIASKCDVVNKIKQKQPHGHKQKVANAANNSQNRHNTATTHSLITSKLFKDLQNMKIQQI